MVPAPISDEFTVEVADALMTDPDVDVSDAIAAAEDDLSINVEWDEDRNGLRVTQYIRLSDVVAWAGESNAYEDWTGFAYASSGTAGWIADATDASNELCSGCKGQLDDYRVHYANIDDCENWSSTPTAEPLSVWGAKQTYACYPLYLAYVPDGYPEVSYYACSSYGVCVDSGGFEDVPAYSSLISAGFLTADFEDCLLSSDLGDNADDPGGDVGLWSYDTINHAFYFNECAFSEMAPEGTEGQSPFTGGTFFFDVENASYWKITYYAQLT